MQLLQSIGGELALGPARCPGIGLESAGDEPFACHESLLASAMLQLFVSDQGGGGGAGAIPDIAPPPLLGR